MNHKIFVTLLVLIFFSMGLYAQRIRAVEVSDKVGDGGKAISVMVYETPQGTVEKEWKSFMKKNDGKISTEHGTMVAHDVLLKDLSTYTLTVYARFEKENDGVNLIVSVAPASEMAGMQRVMENFSREVTKESIAEQQKDAEKELDNAQRALARLERDNSDLHNDIIKYNGKIKDAEKNIEDNLKAQEDAKKVLDEKRKSLDTVKGKAINVN